jgi:hypothetical protein
MQNMSKDNIRTQEEDAKVRIISDKFVKTRKEHHCWGCKGLQPIGTELQAVVTEDEGEIFTIYWCDICLKYMDEHLDYWDRTSGFGYGELREYEDYPEDGTVL